MRASTTFTTPPMAEDPNSKAAGPRSISIRSAVSGLMAMAWSGPDDDRSSVPIPSVSTRTRSPDSPRSTGADAAGPKLVALTPGCRASVSPMLVPHFAREVGLVENGNAAEHVFGAAAHAGDDDLRRHGRRGALPARSARLRLCRDSAAASAAKAGTAYREMATASAIRDEIIVPGCLEFESEARLTRMI